MYVYIVVEGLKGLVIICMLFRMTTKDTDNDINNNNNNNNNNCNLIKKGTVDELKIRKNGERVR